MKIIQQSRSSDLILRLVVVGVLEVSAVGNVEFVSAERPRDELDVARLRVEREVLDVERAVGLDERRKQPQNRSVRLHDRVRHHVVVELVAGAVPTVETYWAHSMGP